MLRRKTVLGMAAMLLIALLMTTPSFSQEQQRGQRGQGGGRQGQGGQGGQRGQGGEGQGQRQGGAQGREQRGQGQFDAERMQEQLGATEAEWKVLGPRVEKVSELSRQLRGGGGGRQRGGAQGGRGRQDGSSQDAQPNTRQNTPAREPSALEKAQEQLRTLLSNTSATPDQIRKQLAALRTAKANAAKQLMAAQTDLRKIITVRQEAQLVMMGMLD